MCQSSIYRLRMLKNLLNTSNKRDWKTLLSKRHPLLSKTLFWSHNQFSLSSLLLNITNPFWKDMMKSWRAYLGNPKEPIDIFKSTIMEQLLLLKIEKKPFYWKPRIDAGILYIKGIIDNNGDFLSYIFSIVIAF